MAKHFSVLAEMAANNQDITACMDMVAANAGKINGKITIGVPSEVVHKFLQKPDGYLTQLLIIDRDQYAAIAARMDKEAQPEADNA